MPVTSVHWWGSYVDWSEPAPPEPSALPIAWRIGFWSNVPASGRQGPVEILAFNGHSDNSPGGEYDNTLGAIADHFTDFNVTATSTEDPATLATELVGKHVLLMPEQENWNTASMSALGVSWSTVVTNFVNAGGTLIVCDFTFPCNQCGNGFLNGTGLMAVGTAISADFSNAQVVGAHPITAGVSSPFLALSGSNAYDSVSGTTVVRQQSSSKPMVAVDDVGAGHVVLIGFDYFSDNTDMTRIIANTVQWAGGARGLFSYPEELLWQVEVDAARVEVEHVGDDWFPHPNIPSDTCFQYYVQLDPDEWFWQADFEADTNDNVYWLSIAAIYDSAAGHLYLTVDDFEAYDDYDENNNPIADTWLDGGFNGTGSFVNLGVAPDPVHTGNQSMHYDYDNDVLWAGSYWSVVERHFGIPQDWAATGANVLALYFYGDPGNDANNTEQMYVALEDGNDVYDEVRYGDQGEDMNDIKREAWQLWCIDLTDFSGVDLNDVNFIYIGFGDKDNNSTPGGDGTVYFDDIGLYEQCPIPYLWGWKTRPWSWMDDAVRFTYEGPLEPAIVLDPCFVEPIKDPTFDESYDVAFELDTNPIWIKWEQPFTGIRDWPHYEDEQSWGSECPDDSNIVIDRLVADDWRCETSTPVTAAVWWGSYIGYSYEACQAPAADPRLKPSYFLLRIWDDVAADDPCNTYEYSHPNDTKWEYKAYDYDEVLVGYDKHPEGAPNEPVFRYSVKLPSEDWFFQEARDTVYWFSVTAIYDCMSPLLPWGWTNHEHFFNDDAVAGTFDGGWFWDNLSDQTGAGQDMSFVLFTDPSSGPYVGTCWDPLECPCQPQGDCSCDGFVNLADLLCLKKHWGTSAPWVDPECCSDYTQNGSVNLADLLALKAGFGKPCPALPSTGNQTCP
jgi:hypothetical protein